MAHVSADIEGAGMKTLLGPLLAVLMLQLASLASAYAQAQPAAVVPAAPVPSPVSSSKTAFVSFVGWDDAALVWASGAGDLAIPYNSFYAGLGSWGRYQLVTAPADSDLILALRVESGGFGTGVISVVRLTILDTKTGVVLWSFAEPIEGITNKRAFAYLPTAVAKLLDDLKTLVNPAAAVSRNSLK